MEHVHSHIWLHIVMRLISACYVGYIVYWVTPIASGRAIVSAHLLGVPMYSVVMRRHFLNGQKSNPPWWLKLAEEYKICTLHVTCHSQVKHMGTPTPPHFSDYLL